MNLDIGTVVAVGLGCSALGWYITRAEIGKPIQAAINWLINKATLSGAPKPLTEWVASGASCRLCVGQWVAILGVAALSGLWPWQMGIDLWWTALAANGVHIALYQITFLDVTIADD